MKSSRLIDGVIQDLRDFSAESPSPGTARFDLNTAIKSAVDLLAQYIKRATDCFAMDLQPGLPPVRGSLQRLEQVFINLILNSCQSLGNRDRAVTVRSCRGETAATLRVTVHDEGAGIPPDILPRVRDQFFTTREASGGTGLGLFVCQEIITAHGGTLELASQPGVGTDAVVTLPAEVAQ
jgi:polar amino acid transport system substrate-binding protein